MKMYSDEKIQNLQIEYSICQRKVFRILDLYQGIWVHAK